MYAQLKKTKNNSTLAVQEQTKKPGLAQRRVNKTGMSAQLKNGMETLSGMDLSDVRVHHNSAKPAQLNAHAYTQGAEIHMAPGQAKHLPHEVGHVVQQRLGRVRPTTQYAGQAINDSPVLERQATAWGKAAMRLGNRSDQAG